MIAALGTSTVYAADTVKDSELVVDKTTTNAGEQVLPNSNALKKVDEVKMGSIQVELTDGKAGTDKSNVKISCRKVADIVHGEYVLTDDYKNAGVDLNKIENSSDLKNAAEKLVSKSSKNGSTNTTDKSGKVIFNSLNVGVYLISAEDSATYDTVEPSLIAVPTWSDTDGNMIYDVVINPKHTAKPEKASNVAPQTGLEENTWKYVGAACICVIGAVGCTIIMRKRKH